MEVLYFVEKIAKTQYPFEQEKGIFWLLFLSHKTQIFILLKLISPQERNYHLYVQLLDLCL